MRRRVNIFVLTLLASIAFAPATDAATALSDEQRRAVLEEAQQAYEQAVGILRTDPIEARARFAMSAARFQLLVEDGVANGRLHYNLGNAWLQAGEVGPAILSYRRAERLIPGDARLESNLSYARTLVRTQIGNSGTRALLDALFGWHESTSLRARFWFAVIGYSLFWVALLLRVVFRRPAWRYVAIALAPLWLAAGVSAGTELMSPPDRGDGVVVADDVIVRKGNGAGFEPQFAEPLHQGVEFTLIDRRPGWLHVRLPDDSAGWIRVDQSALVAEGDGS